MADPTRPSSHGAIPGSAAVIAWVTPCVCSLQAFRVVAAVNKFQGYASHRGQCCVTTRRVESVHAGDTEEPKRLNFGCLFYRHQNLRCLLQRFYQQVTREQPCRPVLSATRRRRPVGAGGWRTRLMTSCGNRWQALVVVEALSHGCAGRNASSPSLSSRAESPHKKSTDDIHTMQTGKSMPQ